MKQIFALTMCIGSCFLNGRAAHVSDTTQNYRSLQHYLQSGSLNGFSRHFFMATDNHYPHHDYISTTGTFGLSYKSPAWKGVQWEYSTYIIYDVYSKYLTEKDSTTGIESRYEIANYDFENLQERSILFRPENLNISYTFGQHKITFGRQYLKTPLINLQDGRMRPSMVEGLWLDSRFGKKVIANFGFLYKMLPRSINSWYAVESSLGLHSTGIDINGNPSFYKNQINSAGIFITRVGYNPLKNLELNVWNYIVQNVFQTSILQAEWKLPLSKSSSTNLFFGGQLFFQSALGNGGSAQVEHAYIPQGSHSTAVSIRAGIEKTKFKLSGNVTFLPDKDRFLIPREWGVEPFYSFISRERLEGSASSRSFAIKTEYQVFPNWNLSFQSAWVDMPDVLDFTKNKYQVPSYFHLNFTSRYQFTGWAEGLKLMVMYVYKGNLGETYNQGKYIMNKVNLSNYNLVFDYSF